jgi:hypothetical protein
VQKNDKDVLKVSDDFVPVKAAERVAMDMLAQQLKEMDEGARLAKDVVKRHLLSLIQLTRTDSVPTDEETPEDELLGASPMGRFSLSASSKIQSLSKEFNDAKSKFTNLLEYFGEDHTMTPEAFFCTVNTFVSMFDQTHKELMQKQEAKVGDMLLYIIAVCLHLDIIIIVSDALPLFLLPRLYTFLLAGTKEEDE